MSKKKELKQEQIDKELLEQFSGGLLFSPEDNRDYSLEDAEVPMCAAAFPEEYRTEGKMPVLNQGVTSECVAHAIATAMGYGEYKAGFKNAHNFSRGMIYGNREDNHFQGEGMYTREALRQVNHYGDCMYDTFPHIGSYPNMKAIFEEGKEKYLSEAEPYKIVNYFRCYNEDDVKRAIMEQGAVVIAINIYEGFGKNVKLPEPGEKSKGGHAMCCVGWTKEGWLVQNSWASVWGDKGYCHIPFEYPVKEWWGITVNKNVPLPPHKTWIQKVGQAIGNFFRKVGMWIKNLFRKKNV